MFFFKVIVILILFIELCHMMAIGAPLIEQRHKSKKN